MGFPRRLFVLAVCLLYVVSEEVEVNMDEPVKASPEASQVPTGDTVTRYDIIMKHRW
jgi:hypothetical protein